MNLIRTGCPTGDVDEFFRTAHCSRRQRRNFFSPRSLSLADSPFSIDKRRRPESKRDLISLALSVKISEAWASPLLSFSCLLFFLNIISWKYNKWFICILSYWKKMVDAASLFQKHSWIWKLESIKLIVIFRKLTSWLCFLKQTRFFWTIHEYWLFY